MSDARQQEGRTASLARELADALGVDGTVRRIVDSAATTLGPDVWASVSMVVKRREVVTPASGDARAGRADQLQYELGEGPCLDAVWEHETVQVDDTTTDPRYPRWAGRVAEETGVRSSLSLQLFVDTVSMSLGALNLYSPRPT